MEVWQVLAALLALGAAAAFWAGRLSRTAATLRQAEQRLRSLAALTSDFFWETDAESRFTRLEGEVGGALGASPAAALGRPIWDVGLRVNGDLAAHLRLLEARLPFREVEFVRLGADRQVAQVLLVSGEPRLGAKGEFLGYRGVARNVTERNRLAAAVRRTQERLRLMIDAMPAIIAYIGRDERYIFVNRGHAELCGLSAAQTAGRSVLEVLGEEDYGAVRQYLARALAGEEVRFERRRRRADGALRDVRAHYVPELDAAGAVRALVVLAVDVTEAMDSRRALAASEARFRDVVELSVDWVWESDARHRLTYVSKEIERLLEVPAGEVLGRARWEMPFLEASPAAWAEHRRVLEARQPFADLRLVRRGRDGRVSHHAVSGRPVFGADGGFLGYRGVGRDVTAEAEAAEALRAERDRLAESELRFRSLFEVSQEGMAVHRDGVVELANSAMARMLGAPGPEALVGMHVEDWVTPEHRDSIRERLQRLQQGESALAYRERKLLRLDGGILEVEIGGAAFVSGGVRRLTLVARDVSARKAHERQARELNAELERRVQSRTAELTAAYREMEAFSSLVSHDLRAPLRAIAGFSRIVLEDFRGEIPAEAQRLLGRVAHNAERMSALIDGLLEFGRLSRQPLRLRRVQPAALAREVLEEQGAERAGRRVEVRVEDMPECRADPVLLKQVYANLISNALKYTRLRAEARIEIGAIAMGLGPVYYVRDNGAGFDAALAKKLFGMFERLHEAHEFEGTGVGLALVQRIVERHGGTVWADSAPDRGATFFFRLGGEAPAAREAGRAAA